MATSWQGRIRCWQATIPTGGMGRGRFLALLASAIAAWPLATSGQQIDKVRRIGYLAADSRHNDEVFRQALRELGYVEGRNPTILYRWGGSGDYEPLAQELVRQNVDLIVAVASLAAGAAGHATKTIPIVIYEVGDPVAYGFVASLAHPGGNITGMSSQLSDIGPKALTSVIPCELPSALPRIRRKRPTTPHYAEALGQDDRHRISVGRRRARRREAFGKPESRNPPSPA